MKVHKVTLMIVDHDDIGIQEVINVLTNTKYPNHCISPWVMETDTRTVEWRDDHPLNIGPNVGGAYKDLFNPNREMDHE